MEYGHVNIDEKNTVALTILWDSDMYIWILIYSIMAHSKCNNYKMVFVSDYCSYYW